LVSSLFMGSGLAETSAPIMRSDGRGNQSVEQWPDGSTITVAYDGFARLTRYKVGLATQDMLYNGDDERIRVVTTPAIGPSDTRIYMYDLDHRIVGEYGGTGITDIKAEYIWTLPEIDATGLTGGDDGTGGYMPLAIVKGSAGEINWVHSHHNGKPLLMTNVTGAIVAYSGHAVLGFPGQFANAVGLAGPQYYYNRYRDYNDTTGRYIQADPIGLAGDANPYAYAMGNALKYRDADGLFLDTLLDLGFIGYDIYRIGKDNIFGRNCPDTLRENVMALTLDIGAALVPFATGAGAASRAVKFSREKQMLVDMAKADKKRGISRADMQAYKDLNAELPDPFPKGQVRGPETHPSRSPSSQQPHGHVGPVNHIPVNK
jgi:RHS repeat-associated protein